MGMVRYRSCIFLLIPSHITSIIIPYIMKQTLTITLLLLSLAGFSQTQKGFHVIGSVGSSNLTRDQRLLITLSPEVGYFGGIFGVTAAYHNTINLYKGSKVKHHNPDGRASSIGLKVYGKVITIDKLSLFLNMEADTYIDRIDKNIKGDYELRPGATLAFPIRKRLDARFSYEKLIYQQGDKHVIWKERDGGAFGIAYIL